MWEARESSQLRRTDKSESTILGARLRNTATTEGDSTSNDVFVDASGQSVVGGWKKVLFLVLAGLFFLLGALGALLPVLPTTPFLLLTSYFLVRTSPRLNAALLKSRWFGPILTDWQVHGGVRRDIRVKAIVAVAIVVAVSVFLSGYSLIPSLTVIILAAVGITVILRLPAARIT